LSWLVVTRLNYNVQVKDYSSFHLVLQCYWLADRKGILLQNPKGHLLRDLTYLGYLGQLIITKVSHHMGTT